MESRQRKIKTNIGTLYICVNKKGLTHLSWEEKNIPYLKKNDLDEIHQNMNQVKLELDEYLSGKRKSFSVPINFTEGTDFQKKVWKQLIKIPFGKSCSYIDIAKKIGNENASRAVGGANGKNPICIIVPCHRVITSSGKIGGFTAGVEVKKKLLNLEGQTYENS